MSSSLDIGFYETDFEDWEVQSRHFPSKVGGRPAWLDLEHLPAPEVTACPQCGQPRVFLLQVYAPDNAVSEAFHRTLFLFICKSDACWNTEDKPVLVLRSQLARDNLYYPSQPPVDGPGWRPDIVPGVQCPVCAVCGARGDMRCGRCRSVSYCGQSHQKLDWRAGHKQQCGAEGEMRSNVKWALGEGLLVMEEEPDTEEMDDQEEQRLRSMVDMGDSLEAGEEEWEEIEKGQKEDKVMEKFKKRLRRCPDQVLRYERRGRPLECSAQPLQPPPPCQKCGGQRTFEFSVMPQLLSELGLSDSCDNGGLDWGSVHVYTCDNSCSVKGYVAEHVSVQDFELSNIPGTDKPQ